MARTILALGAAIGGAAAAYKLVVEPWWRSWGVAPSEAARPLPGDEILAGTDVTVDTRGITIDAPPSAVWPWLAQMGFGRAGWYSYDQVDMTGRSSDRILPQYQSLNVGDTVPTHPGGGFEVRAVEPDRHLVLYVDSDMARRWAQEAEALNAESPSNLRVAGAFMEGTQPPEFGATWAFVLEDLGGQTRLIERFRIRFGDDGQPQPWMRFSLPMMRFGVFVMIRRQMLGLKDRAEGRPAASPVEPATA